MGLADHTRPGSALYHRDLAVGSLGRGSERVLYQLNLIQVQSENLAKVECHGGVFVPGRGK